MTVLDLLLKADRAGLHLRPVGDQIGVSPTSRLTPELASELRTHKSEVLAVLSRSRGWKALPPLNLKLSSLKPSPTPKRLDMVVAYMRRQSGDPLLKGWLNLRVMRYEGAHGADWPPALNTYSAARDAACWQLERTEAGLWDLLDGIEDCLSNLNRKAQP